jgi:4'-phosphopantetheinyl transferase
MPSGTWSGYHLGTRLPRLAGGRLPRPVTVWLTAPHSAHAVAEAWLSDEERRRLATMQHPRARSEFLTGRWLLRGLLGELLDGHPREVPLRVDPQGALRVEGCPTLGVNLSHTAGLVAIAVAEGHDVGVDVEWTGRPGRTVELAHRWFAAAELAALMALPDGPPRRHRFFELWTLKEGYIKARGLGLRVPLGSFAFAFGASGVGLSVEPAAGDSDPTRWRALTTQVGPDHQLGLVWGARAP